MPKSPPSLAHHWPVLLGLAIGLAPLVVSVRHGFYLDDFTWLARAHLTESPLQAITDPWLSGFIRPVGQLFFYFEYRLFGFASIAYNLLGIGLHGIAGFLVYLATRRAGGTPWISAALVVLFLTGAGHFAKPVVWACSHPILLGTLLTLTSGLALDGGRRARAIATATTTSLLAMLTHDLFVLVPIAVSVLLVFRCRSRYWGTTALLFCAGLAYLMMGVSYRSQVAVPNGFGIHIVTNALHAAACLVGPFSSVPAAASAIGRLGGEVSPLWIRAGFLTLGGGVVAGLFSSLIRAGIPVTWLVLLLATIAPPLLIESNGDWIDPRYLYPGAAVAMPLIQRAVGHWRRRLWGGVEARGLSTPGALPRGTRERPILFSAVIFWYCLVLLGNLSMQKDAIRESTSERAAHRWESLQRIVSR